MPHPALIRRLAALCAVLVTLVALPGTTWAGQYALLVGVSQYRNDEAWQTLGGPPNDIPALYLSLLKRGFRPENIRVLADHIGPDGGMIHPVGLPTRHNVLDQFAWLVSTVLQGDQIFVLLSGHGDELETGVAGPNGRPEVEHAYIPYDAGPAAGPRLGNGPIENSILHTEIGAFLDQLRASKTETWVVIDTCHSGGLSRALGPEDGPPAPLSAEPVRAVKLGGGGVVTFMAAQKADLIREVTEVRVTTDASEPVSYGPLSLLVSRILASDEPMTYAEAAQRVLAGYEFFRRTVWQPTMPLFDGELAHPIFGAALAAAERVRWPAVNDGLRIRIEAGRLSGLEPGRELQLWGSINENGRRGLSPPELLGRAVVEQAELNQSFARVTGGMTLAATYLLAEPTEPVQPTNLRVTLSADLAQAPWFKPAQEHLLSDGRFSLVTAGGDADYRMQADAQGLWIVPADSSIASVAAVGGQPVQLAGTPDEVAEQLYGRFQQLAQRDHLLRLVDGVADPQLSRFLRIDMLLLRGPVAAGVPGRCARAPKTPPDAAVPVSPEAIPDLRHCDTLYLRMSNTGPNPLDLGLCMVDGTGQVQTADNLVNLRLLPREPSVSGPITLWSWDLNRNLPSTGPYRLVLLAVERRDRTALSFPLQISSAVCPRTLQTRSMIASGASPEERQVLDGLAGADGAATRQLAVSRPTLKGSIVRLLRWNQLPVNP